jgi:hypothetical protein
MTRHGICPPAAFFTETMPSTAPRRRNARLNRGEGDRWGRCTITFH